MFESEVMSYSENDVIPQYNPSNRGTLQGVIDEALNSLLKNTDDMLPATVIGYDRVSNVASVQPSIYSVATDGTLIKKASIASVPVFALGGGGFVVNFPLVSGSRGWIKAGDRDISLYLQAMNNAAPNTKRMHTFENGLFIPDIVSGFTINGEDTNNMVIQTLDGTIRVAIWPDRVKVTTPNATGQFGPDRLLFTTPLFQINSPIIQFATAPHVGPLTP